nr:hypothetical protein [Mimivirus sp.]
MDNINLHYDGLYKSNPLVGGFELIEYCWENNKQYLDQISNLNISDPNKDNYIEPNSCPIYSGITDPELTIINGEPSVIKYNILFTVAHLNNKPSLKLKKNTIHMLFINIHFMMNIFTIIQLILKKHNVMEINVAEIFMFQIVVFGVNLVMEIFANILVIWIQ